MDVMMSSVRLAASKFRWLWSSSNQPNVGNIIRVSSVSSFVVSLYSAYTEYKRPAAKHTRYPRNLLHEDFKLAPGPSNESPSLLPIPVQLVYITIKGCLFSQRISTISPLRLQELCCCPDVYALAYHLLPEAAQSARTNSVLPRCAGIFLTVECQVHTPRALVYSVAEFKQNIMDCLTF